MRATEFAFPLEVKFAEATGEITGYGSTFGNVDLGGDKCMPGCFAKSIAEHEAAGSMPAMLWSHDPSEPVGVWTDASEDGHGLKLRGKLTLGTQRGTDARALAKDGALALSIGYATRDAEYVKGHRLLKDVALYEISLVSMPMNPAARLTSVKSMNAADDIRDAVTFQRFLKSHGFPNALARRLAAGWTTAVGRPGDDEAEQLIAELKHSAARFSKG